MGGVVSRIFGGERDASYRGTHPGLSNSNIFNWFNDWWSSEGSDVRDPGEDEKKENEDKPEKPDKPGTPTNPEDPKPENEADDKPEPKPETPIKIENVDFNVNYNTEAHRTSEYSMTTPADGKTAQLIVRRGQIFDIIIKFNRPYNYEKDKVRLLFQFGKKPLQHKATHVEVALSKDDVSACHWGATILTEKENNVTVRVVTPPTLYVGKWTFRVDVIKKYLDKNIVYRYKHPEPIYILFNPWCKDDAVFHHDDDLLNEYVLNQSGIIFQGYHRYPARKNWDFAQFQSPVLDCTLFLLEKSNMSVTSRGDPVSVCRRLSALANGPDDDGILVGNWSGDYSGGTSPLSWTGSLAIIEEYMKNNEPVKYGQCWVFSAILTTLCRALGIPTRSVTNFASAHDTDKSLTIDTFFDENDKELNHLNADSIWNFHVWNDVWMARDDLPKGYGGWQALDSTPQELSDRVYCCGPASLIALKRGEVHLLYDAGFIFAEVNADEIYWLRKADGSICKTKIDKTSVGKKVSTHKPKCRRDYEYDLEENVTQDYKYKEGHAAERSSVIRANMTGSTRPEAVEYKDCDVDFEVVEMECIKYGEDFTVKLIITNNSKEIRTLGGGLSAHTIYYTGVTYRHVKTEHFNQNEILPGKSEELKMVVKIQDYLEKLVDHCNFHLSCLFRVKETNQVFTKVDFLSLEKPDLILEGPVDSVIVGEPCKINVSFTNPLPVKLTKCMLRLEGSGIQRPRTISQKNVEPGTDFKTCVDVTPNQTGNKEITMCFNATQIESVNGSCVLNVLPKQ